MNEADTSNICLMHVRDFPADLHDEVAERLAFSSVGFSAIEIVGGAEQSTASGSGTLVRIAGRLAILTADHVVEQLKSADRVGLLVDWTGEVRRCAYERQHLTFARLARGSCESQGPDLAVIFLPPTLETTAILRANKVFYDLDRRIASLPGSYAGVEWGFWFPCGVPAEGAHELGPMREFANVRAHWALCAVAARPKEFEHGKFDYLDIRVPSDGKDVPDGLGGMSGAGLWQVRFRRAPDGSFRIQDHVLSGVAFYECYKPDRLLRCHGRRSLHEELPRLLERYFAGSG